MKLVCNGILLVLCLGLLSPVFGESLFLEYTEKSEQELKQETRMLTREIRDQFQMASMETAQQKIDAYDYLSHFKRILLYGEKLATYAEYEEDLAFAKDNELFKGLPEAGDTPGETPGVKPASAPAGRQPNGPEADGNADLKSDFVDEKYRRMSVDVKSEIETYEDLIIISLDACELLTVNDFSGFSDAPEFRRKVTGFLRAGKRVEKFRVKQERLAKAWPDLNLRIQRQITLWEGEAPRPGDPLVNPGITEAISRGQGV